MRFLKRFYKLTEHSLNVKGTDVVYEHPRTILIKERYKC